MSRSLLPCVLLLLSAPLLHALHDGDNYCDNGPNRYFCTADCTGYYYCAGAQRGQVQTCASDAVLSPAGCSEHGAHLMPPQLKNMASEMPLVAGTCQRGEALAYKLGNWPTTCWKGGAVDPCAAKSCSGHGICRTSGSPAAGAPATGCTCATGWSTGGTKAGIECDVNPKASGGETCPGKLEMMIVIDRSGSVQTTPQDFEGERCVWILLQLQE